MEPTSQRLYRFDDKEITATGALTNAIQSMMDKPQYQGEWHDELTTIGLTPEQFTLEAYVALCMVTDASLRFDALGTLVIS